MNNSKILIDKLAKLFEQGMITSKDLGDEIKNILKFKHQKIFCLVVLRLEILI